ncbi:MAG TPA: HK97-gp10 family putative phage morphogenesis protein [Phycisphaerae bacterium]|nr:HK97-gp10 family putative phage morphogenesis protein [Phycisphaerae bacterium]
MAAVTDFKITWNDVLEKALKRAPTEALNRLAEHVTAEAKRRSPFKTGTNRRSINWDASRGGERRIFTQSGYGGYLELGTKKMAARPFIRPALEAVKQRAAEILKDLI